MKKNIEISVILMIALTIHIFAVQTKLLYHINTEMVKDGKFSFLSIDEFTMLSMVFAISYSLATISVLTKTKNKQLIFFIGFLDAIGVLLYYYKDFPRWLGALFYALYTFTLIISIWYMKSLFKILVA